MFRPAGILLALFLLSAPLQAQFNAYKYVVVPTHFEGYPKPNQHQTSTLIKYYLAENGYPAVYDTQQPTELRVQPCLGVFTRLHDTSGMFVTRVTLEFVDCEGKQVFETMEGTSRLKDFVQAYKEAIQNAFLSFSGRGYSYHPVAATPTTPAAPAVQAETPVAVAAAAAAVAEPVAEAAPVAEEAAAEVAEQAAAEVAEQAAPLPAIGAVAAASEKEPEVWYAQPIENGYQLVDSFPRIRMKLMKTSVPDVYIALMPDPSNKFAPDTAKGMVYSKDGKWVHEYFEGGVQYQEPLQIKF